MPQGFLLDPSADLVERGGPQLDDMERVEHRDGVFEVLVDGVLVTVERIQRRLLDPPPEAWSPFFEPVAVGLPGPAGNQIEQPGPGLAVRTGGQVDHAGQLFGTPPAQGRRQWRDVMPDVLVDPETFDAVEA